MTTKVDFRQLTTDDILSVYSGKDGRCCCGCAGKHYYNPAFIDEGTKDRGYKVDQKETSRTMVSKILGIIQTADPKELHGGDHHLSRVIRTRLYIVYFRANVQGTVPTEDEEFQLQERIKKLARESLERQFGKPSQEGEFALDL